MFGGLSSGARQSWRSRTLSLKGRALGCELEAPEILFGGPDGPLPLCPAGGTVRATVDIFLFYHCSKCTQAYFPMQYYWTLLDIVVISRYVQNTHRATMACVSGKLVVLVSAVPRQESKPIDTTQYEGRRGIWRFMQLIPFYIQGPNACPVVLQGRICPFKLRPREYCLPFPAAAQVAIDTQSVSGDSSFQAPSFPLLFLRVPGGCCSVCSTSQSCNLRWRSVILLLEEETSHTVLIEHLQVFLCRLVSDLKMLKCDPTKKSRHRIGHGSVCL